MRPLALITGASGGLGEQFARLWAASGHDLVLVARGKEALERLKNELEGTQEIEVTVVVEDLSDAESARRLASSLPRIPDVLVNNAGFGDYAPFAEADPKRIASMITLNVLTLTLLTREILPGMVARGSGRILNVASVAAFQPGPLMAVYYATKAYVLSFSLALSDETRGTGVTVTCLCPGPTATGFVSGANLESSRLFRLGTMDPQTVAKQGFDATNAGRPLLTTGLRNKIGAFLTRFAPRMTAARIARLAQSKT